MIWTIKIQLLYGQQVEDPWESGIEIDAESTLEDIHYVIQSAVKFDNDHMYEFYISRTENSHDRTIFDNENEKIYTTTLDDLYPLKKNMNLYYMFDYGDCWLFKISKTRKKPHEPVKGVEYPVLIEEKGVPPEQYPDYDDDED